MKNDQKRRSSSKGGLSLLFDMDTLKRRGSKSSPPNGSTVPHLLVTMSPETTKRAMKQGSKQRRIKIAILGKTGVGKSALVVRYLTKRFIGEYSADESRVETQVEIDEENILMEILDTCKPTEEKLLEHINWADGFILVFSITSYWSLFEVARLTSVIKQSREDEKVPIVVFSNQTDMETKRGISRNEARQFLNDLGKPVFQTSAARNYDGVRNAFDEASRLVYKWKFPGGKPRSRSSSLCSPRGRSGSIMDPLREAFMRLHAGSSEDVRRSSSTSHHRPITSVVDLHLRHDSLESVDEGKPTGKRRLIANFLSVPHHHHHHHGNKGHTEERRNRSHSFA